MITVMPSGPPDDRLDFIDDGLAMRRGYFGLPAWARCPCQPLHVGHRRIVIGLRICSSFRNTVKTPVGVSYPGLPEDMVGVAPVSGPPLRIAQRCVAQAMKSTGPSRASLPGFQTNWPGFNPSTV